MKTKVYPKPSVLDVNWENHDIHVAEWANIPKFPPLLNGDCFEADGMFNPNC